MSDHAYLAPSSAPIWGFCSGSVTAQMSAGNPDSQESRNGTAAHWVGSECLKAWQAEALDGPTCDEWLGRVDPDGTVIDDKMVEGAQIYVNEVLRTAQGHAMIGDLWIEQRVGMSTIHPENWGTLDACLPVLNENVIYLWDYKHGHREVDALGNLQMIDYLVGVMEKLGIDGHQEQRVDFVIRIVQPFAYSAKGAVTEWRGKLSELRAYVNQLISKAQEAFENPLFTGGAHCRDCTALGKCSTGRRWLYAWADYVNEPYSIDDMSAYDLAAERKLLKGMITVAKARLDAVEEDLTYRVKQGKGEDANLALATTEGRLTWIKEIPVDQIIAVCKQFDVDGQKDAAITPTQAIAKCNSETRDIFKEVLKTFAKRPVGLALIPVEESITSLAFKPKGK